MPDVTKLFRWKAALTCGHNTETAPVGPRGLLPDMGCVRAHTARTDNLDYVGAWPISRGGGTVCDVDNDLANFYATCAQVIPVMLLVVAIETGLGSRLMARAAIDAIKVIDKVREELEQDGHSHGNQPDENAATNKRVPAEGYSIGSSSTVNISVGIEVLTARSRREYVGNAPFAPRTLLRRAAARLASLRWLLPLFLPRAVIAMAIACEAIAIIALAFPPAGVLRAGTIVLLLSAIASLGVLTAFGLIRFISEGAEQRIRDVRAVPDGTKKNSSADGQ